MKTRDPAFALALAASATLNATNVAINPASNPAPAQPLQSRWRRFASPAANWTGWNNSPGLTTLEILPSTLPLASAGSQMLHIQTTGDRNGVFQFISGGASYAGAWMYVLSGAAEFGAVQTGSGYPTSTPLN